MISSNLTAVLVKVAGIGLTKDHLGKTLGAMQPTLTKLVSFLADPFAAGPRSLAFPSPSRTQCTVFMSVEREESTRL
jgi:hypothetical protein